MVIITHNFHELIVVMHTIRFLAWTILSLDSTEVTSRTEERTNTSHLSLHFRAKISLFRKLVDIPLFSLVATSSCRKPFQLGPTVPKATPHGGKGAGWWKSYPCRGGTSDTIGVIQGHTQFFHCSPYRLGIQLTVFSFINPEVIHVPSGPLTKFV